MWGYIIVIALMTIWFIICNQSKTNKNRNFLIGTTILMSLFYGLRGSEVGGDTFAYIDSFYETAVQPTSLLWEYIWEQKSPLYSLAEWVFGQIIPHHQIWLFATSVLFFVAMSLFIHKNSEDPYLSYVIFFAIFGTFQTTGIRQSCAMAVLMFAYEYVKKNQPIKFTLLIAVAFLLHKSSIIFFAVYWLSKRKIRVYDLPVLVAMLVAIYMNRSFLFDFIKSFTSYSYYEQLEHGEPVNFSIMIYGATVVGTVLCYILSYRLKKKRKTMTPVEVQKGKLSTLKNDLANYSRQANIMYLASIFMPLVALNGAVRRIVMYFAMFMIFLIPKLIKEAFDSTVAFCVKLVLSSILILLLIDATIGSPYAYSLFFM